MVAGGVPVQDHTRAIALLAVEMMQEIKRHKPFGESLNMRIGFHTGPVVAGVIGMRKFSYDIWGDAANMAGRLEPMAKVARYMSPLKCTPSSRTPLISRQGDGSTSRVLEILRHIS